MAIDLKKMRAKLDAMQNKGKGKSNWWKPSDGDQSIRIVPTPDGDPFKEHWFHYNVGNGKPYTVLEIVKVVEKVTKKRIIS